MLVPSPIDTLTAENKEKAASPISVIQEQVGERALDVVERAEEHARAHAEFELWASTVRDPAWQFTEGARRLKSANGKAVAEYEIAPLPDGRWALRTDFEYRGVSGRSSPWKAFATRDECVAEFLKRLREDLADVPQGCHGEHHRQGRIQLLDQLQGNLFGFMEPEPDAEDLPPLPEDPADTDE